MNDAPVHSRPGHAQTELEKIRNRMGGKVEPNASGATVETLPTSDASLAARIKLTPEQEALAQKNRELRAAHRRAQLQAQREADTQNTPTGEPPAASGPTEATMNEFTAGMSEEEKAEFVKAWNEDPATEDKIDAAPDASEDELSDDELLDRDPPTDDVPQATGEG